MFAWFVLGVEIEDITRLHSKVIAAEITPYAKPGTTQSEKVSDSTITDTGVMTAFVCLCLSSMLSLWGTNCFI